MSSGRKMLKTARKLRLGEADSDFSYWQTKSYPERLAALEEIRREYNDWKYRDAEQRFQRVFRKTQTKLRSEVAGNEKAKNAELDALLAKRDKSELKPLAEAAKCAK